MRGYPDDPLVLPATTWAYIAGIIDGEGCLGVYPLPRTDNYQVRITVSQVTSELPTWLQKTLGGTTRRAQFQDDRSDRYTWGCYSTFRSRKIIRCCLPWLIVKKPQAELIVRHVPNRALAAHVKHLKRVHRV